MAVPDHSTAESADVSSVVDAVRAAELVQFITVPTGDGLAATGLLATACDALDRPYHVGVVQTAKELAERLAAVDASATTLTLGVGADGVVGLNPDGPISPVAYEAAVALGVDPSPVAALAGVVAADAVPSQVAPDLLDEAGLERIVGAGVPTADLTDGLAHSGLFHADFSGDLEATGEVLASCGLADANTIELAESDARRAASLVALEAGASQEAPPRAAIAVERALRPYRTDRPFSTLAGHADVLSALAEHAPGLAVALPLGSDVRAVALDAWRDHARQAHAALRDAATARHHGLLVARTDGPLVTIARLLRDYRTAEPVVLAIGAGEAAAVSLDKPVTDPLATAAAAADGSSLACGERGWATFEPDRTERFIETFREALP